MADNKENQETQDKDAVEAPHPEAPQPESPEVHFEPLVKLSLVETNTMEENEDILLQLRAKLYRYDTESDPREWKERGVGDCRILKHKESGHIRILMRRDKTLKICANHYIIPGMELKPNCGSDRAWVWSTSADFADEESKEEVLAIRFGNADNAQKFKTVFEKSRDDMEKIIDERFEEADKKAAEVKENGDAEENSREEDSTRRESATEGDGDDRPEADQLSGQLKELTVKDTVKEG